MADTLDPGSSFDALLPAETGKRCEDLGVARASLSLPALLGLAVLAGGFVGLGCAFMTLVAAGTGSLPFGVSRLLQGLAFCLGPVLVVVAGAELFGANDLTVMAFMNGKIPLGRICRVFAVTYAGNLVGALTVAALTFSILQYKAGGGVLGASAVRLASARCSLGFPQAVALGFMGNSLLCLAVWLTLSARSTADRIVSLVGPLTALAAAGFEYSVASMYLVPMGLLIAWLDPGFVAGLGADVGSLTLGSFVLRNLLPVTLGNIVGGAGLVGLVYWFLYLRPQRARQPEAAQTVADSAEQRRDRVAMRTIDVRIPRLPQEGTRVVD